MGFFGGLNAEKYDRQYTDRQLVGHDTDRFVRQEHLRLAQRRLLSQSRHPERGWRDGAASSRSAAKFARQRLSDFVGSVDGLVERDRVGVATENEVGTREGK